MYVEYLKVKNFRNIQSLTLTLIPKYNLFVGANGQGKTNLLEAVLFLATSTSHRTNREKHLIEMEQDVAYILGELVTQSGPKRLETGLSKDKKVIKLQGKPLSRVGDLYGHLRVVLFAPEDLHIIKGSPRIRRKFLDMTIAQLQPDHVSLLQKYRKMLRQRQMILRAILTTEARERLGRIKIARPEVAINLENQLIMLAQAGRLRAKINDRQLQELLTRFLPKKRDITIRRR